MEEFDIQPAGTDNGSSIVRILREQEVNADTCEWAQYRLVTVICGVMQPSLGLAIVTGDTVYRDRRHKCLLWNDGQNCDVQRVITPNEITKLLLPGCS